MQDIIAELKKNNFKVERGKEGDVILALAQYAAQDSNLTNNQIGNKGKIVTEVTSKLIKTNPNIKSIINSVIPETRKELQECKKYNKKRLFEAKQWTAKKFLAGLLILGAAAIASPNLQAASLNNVNVTAPVEITNKINVNTKGTNMSSIIRTPLEEQSNKDIDLSKEYTNKITSKGQKGYAKVYINRKIYTTTVNFKSEDGAREGKLLYIIHKDTTDKTYYFETPGENSSSNQISHKTFHKNSPVSWEEHKILEGAEMFSEKEIDNILKNVLRDIIK